jgi:hypothetical protein
VIQEVIYSSLSVKVAVVSHTGLINLLKNSSGETESVEYCLCQPLSIGHELDFIASRIGTEEIRWMKYKEAENALSDSQELKILNNAFQLLAENAEQRAKDVE